MSLSMLLALTACPAMLGTQEAIHQGQAKNRREEHRARRCNLIVTCIKVSHRAAQLNGKFIALKNAKLYISNGGEDEHYFHGYYLPYPDTKYEGLVSTITSVAPILNWIYVDKDTYEVKYGVRDSAQPHLTGPFDCTRQDRRLTFEDWEGFVAVEEQPGQWALYFDRDDNGLRGKIQPGKKSLEVILTRVERKKSKEDAEKEKEQAKEFKTMQLGQKDEEKKEEPQANGSANGAAKGPSNGAPKGTANGTANGSVAPPLAPASAPDLVNGIPSLPKEAPQGPPSPLGAYFPEKDGVVPRTPAPTPLETNEKMLTPISLSAPADKPGLDVEPVPAKGLESKSCTRPEAGLKRSGSSRSNKRLSASMDNPRLTVDPARTKDPEATSSTHSIAEHGLKRTGSTKKKSTSPPTKSAPTTAPLKTKTSSSDLHRSSSSSKRKPTTTTAATTPNTKPKTSPTKLPLPPKEPSHPPHSSSTPPPSSTSPGVKRAASTGKKRDTASTKLPLPLSALLPKEFKRAVRSESEPRGGTGPRRSSELSLSYSFTPTRVLDSSDGKASGKGREEKRMERRVSRRGGGMGVGKGVDGKVDGKEGKMNGVVGEHNEGNGQVGKGKELQAYVEDVPDVSDGVKVSDNVEGALMREVKMETKTESEQLKEPDQAQTPEQSQAPEKPQEPTKTEPEQPEQSTEAGHTEKANQSLELRQDEAGEAEKAQEQEREELEPEDPKESQLLAQPSGHTQNSTEQERALSPPVSAPAPEPAPAQAPPTQKDEIKIGKTYALANGTNGTAMGKEAAADASAAAEAVVGLEGVGVPETLLGGIGGVASEVSPEATAEVKAEPKEVEEGEVKEEVKIESAKEVKAEQKPSLKIATPVSARDAFSRLFFNGSPKGPSVVSSGAAADAASTSAALGASGNAPSTHTGSTPTGTTPTRPCDYDAWSSSPPGGGTEGSATPLVHTPAGTTPRGAEKGGTPTVVGVTPPSAVGVSASATSGAPTTAGAAAAAEDANVNINISDADASDVVTTVDIAEAAAEQNTPSRSTFLNGHHAGGPVPIPIPISLGGVGGAGETTSWWAAGIPHTTDAAVAAAAAAAEEEEEPMPLQLAGQLGQSPEPQVVQVHPSERPPRTHISDVPPMVGTSTTTSTTAPSTPALSTSQSSRPSTWYEKPGSVITMSETGGPTTTTTTTRSLSVAAAAGGSESLDLGKRASSSSSFSLGRARRSVRSVSGGGGSSREEKAEFGGAGRKSVDGNGYGNGGSLSPKQKSGWRAVLGERIKAGRERVGVRRSASGAGGGRK